MGGFLKNALQRENLAKILRVLNAGRPAEMGEPVQPHERGKPAKQNLEWTKKQSLGEPRLRDLRGALEPIAKCLKELPLARSVEHQKEEHRKHRNWSDEDEVGFRRLRRADLRSRVPFERRLAWKLQSGIPLTKAKIDRAVRDLVRTPNFRLTSKMLQHALRKETREERTKALLRLKAKGAPIRYAGTDWAFHLNMVNSLVEWTSLRLEYSKSGELVVRRVRPAHCGPGLYQDTRERRRRIAAIRDLLSLAEHGVVRHLHQCPGCRWWFDSRSHGKYCPGRLRHSASKCKQAADINARKKNEAAMNRPVASPQHTTAALLAPRTARGRL
jgi:hypothetical protein